MFRGRRARAERTMTIGPDGSVTLAGYSLAEALRMAKDPEFRKVMREARETSREKPRMEAVRDLG
jgi:hypothetical protein